MKIQKTQKGITLVALIITIVVLLILAIVTIGAVQDSKIIAHAQNAGNQYSLEQEKEKINLTVSEAYIGGKGKIAETDLTGALNTQFGDNWLYLSKTTEYFKVQIKSTERLYKISVGGKVEEDELVTVSDASYFTFDGTTLTGVTDEGKADLESLAGKSVKLVIPDNTTEIQEHAFANLSWTLLNKLSDFSIESKSVTTIGEVAFGGCTSLVNVSLPAVTNLERAVFTGCTSLTNLSLPAVTTVDENSFVACDNLESITMDSITDVPYRFVC